VERCAFYGFTPAAQSDVTPAAQKLQVTTYPFVAFLALQPRRGTRSAASNTNGTTTNPPTLTILSRHQGRCAPTSTSPTSPTSLTTHLNSQLLPRILPFLERIRNTARERDRDRLLREEQDRAFRDAARRDRERIQGRMEEERRKVEEQSRRKEEAMREVERREVERVEEENKEAARMEWRRWARRIAVEPQANATTSDAKGSGVIRLAIRLPGGDRRSIREFSPSDTLTNLYAYVDSQFIPPSLPTSSDPLLPPENDLTSPEQTPDERIEAQIRAQSSAPSSGAVGEGKADIWWGFKLVLAYPRRELAWAPHTALRDIEGLKGGAQIVVEKVGVSPKARGSSTSPRSAAASPTPPAKEDEAEDGYDTESD
jgi:FAS-associated factor 2